MNIRFLVTAAFFIFSFLGKAQDFKKTAGFEKFNGFFDFYYDDSTDKIYLQVDRLDTEFLYVNSLSSGIGSNDIGLDRGQLGNEQVVYFKKAGNKLLLIQPNLRFRALTDNALERKSVEQAFAKSILHGFVIKEESKASFLIDLTDFLLRDAHGVVNRLKNTNQGTYSLDKSKSALAMERTKAFPKNVEFDISLTFKGNPKGSNIRSVAPNASLVNVAQHHSFIELPDANYKQREFTPGCGAYPFSYYDYATPVEEPILKRYITRHRLQKKDPTAAVSEAIEPIIYYLDNGTPEPVRSALLDGGKWWNQAFEAIGYKDAFQLKILPDDADPLDVRYNVIQWVHRSTRGWSYGSSVTDPRTGEIIKGHVSLGSLRIRQDFLIAQALMDKPFATRDDNHQQMLDLALARIRQLSAHEIGHTIGFAHNFAASTNGRASVMDYPHPQFKLKDNKIDFSEAYATGIGAWDKVSVAYAYATFSNDENEQTELLKILEQARNQGLRYITDQDARPSGGAHVSAHLWDNGKSASAELEAVLGIRKQAIANFSMDNIRSSEPNSVLEDVFAPLYFFHRYQAEAVAKVVGGLDYNYAIKGDGQTTVTPVTRKVQEQALEAMLQTVTAEVLAIPEDKLGLFPPRSFGYPRTRESLKSKMGVGFDPLAAAETASSFALGLLMHPERANRLVLQKGLDPNQMGLAEVVDALVNKTLKSNPKKGYKTQVQKVINRQVLQSLMHLSSHKDSYPQVTETIVAAILELNTYYGSKSKDASAVLMKIDIEAFMKNPRGFSNTVEVRKIPDGSPIGMDCFH